MFTTIYTYILENWDTLLSVIGTASVLAMFFAKLTKNKVDDKIVAFVQKLLDLAALNPERKALEAGDKAVAENPPAGLGSVVGDTLDVD